MRFQFKRELYSKTALLKAAYNYTDTSYVHLDADEEYYYVDIELKKTEKSIDDITEKEFINEILTQSVRHEVYRQTKNIRELLLARAMATTVITDSKLLEEEGLFDDNYDESEILKDWFERNEDIGS